MSSKAKSASDKSRDGLSKVVFQNESKVATSAQYISTGAGGTETLCKRSTFTVLRKTQTGERRPARD